MNSQPLGFVCTSCGVEKRLYYTLAQVARLYGLSVCRVGQYARAGILVTRFNVRRGRSIRRVVLAADLQAFQDWFLPSAADLRSDSPSARARLAFRLWSWVQGNGRKGAARSNEVQGKGRSAEVKRQRTKVRDSLNAPSPPLVAPHLDQPTKPEVPDPKSTKS